MMRSVLLAGFAVVMAAAFFTVAGTAGMPSNGLPSNGLPSNGISSNGMPSNGLPTNGTPSNGTPSNSRLSTTATVAPPFSNSGALPPCFNAEAAAEIKSLSEQAKQIAAMNTARQNEVSALAAKRAALLAAIAAASTPQEKASRQAMVDAINAKIAALNGAIANGNAQINSINAQIAKLRALKHC
jgi:hypothetical protein